jgi:hypothetical protein
MTEVINIMRHESVFDPTQFDYPMHVIGAGATGSRVFAALVELGMRNINVYDPDIVEDHNLANQIYLARDINGSKVLGCMNFVKDKLGVEKNPEGFDYLNLAVTSSYIREGNVCGGVVFILTDTMKSRKNIFDALVSRCNQIHAGQAGRTEPYSPIQATYTAPILIIETRMGSTHGSVFTIDPFNKESREQWESTLVDDEDEDNIELSPCGTTLSVGTTASLIANYAVWQMMQFFVDPVGLQPRIDLFFKPTLTITSPAIAA